LAAAIGLDEVTLVSINPFVQIANFPSFSCETWSVTLSALKIGSACELVHTAGVA
jgi:hypothetical protein